MIRMLVFHRQCYGVITLTRRFGVIDCSVTFSPDRQRQKPATSSWRIWNGKAKDAQKSIVRIRAVMHHFRGEPDNRKSTAPSRKLWTALHALDGYLIGQSVWLVNYAGRHRAGSRVGIAITEGTANFMVNRRMNKSQQMRWSRRGADLLLQVRCAIYNGTLGFAGPAKGPLPHATTMDPGGSPTSESRTTLSVRYPKPFPRRFHGVRSRRPPPAVAGSGPSAHSRIALLEAVSCRSGPDQARHRRW